MSHEVKYVYFQQDFLLSLSLCIFCIFCLIIILISFLLLIFTLKSKQKVHLLIVTYCNFIWHLHLFTLFWYRLCFIPINLRTKSLYSLSILWSFKWQSLWYPIIQSMCSSSIIRKNFLYLKTIVIMWIL